MSKLATKLYFKGLAAKENFCKILKKENGEANIIAIILVLAIVVALAIIFKDQLQDLFDQIWSSIFDDAGEVLD